MKVLLCRHLSIFDFISYFDHMKFLKLRSYSLLLYMTLLKGLKMRQIYYSKIKSIYIESLASTHISKISFEPTYCLY